MAIGSLQCWKLDDPKGLDTLGSHHCSKQPTSRLLWTTWIETKFYVRSVLSWWFPHNMQLQFLRKCTHRWNWFILQIFVLYHLLWIIYAVGVRGHIPPQRRCSYLIERNTVEIVVCARFLGSDLEWNAIILWDGQPHYSWGSHGIEQSSRCDLFPV